MHRFIHQSYRRDTKSRKAVFLDRDGTLIRHVNYLSRKNQVAILPGVPDAIQLLNKNNFIVIVVTNQPVIAKGLASVEDVRSINTMIVETLLAKNASVHAVYSCPHHPEGNLPTFAVSCQCRKPNVAMFQKAVEDFNIDLKHSYVIGDSTRDIQAGKTLGIPTFLVKTGYGGNDKAYAVTPDHTCDTLFRAVKMILNL